MKVIESTCIAYSVVRQVMTIDWGTFGGPLCRLQCHYCINMYSMEEYVHRLLTSKEGIERKGLRDHGEDHNHDLWYRP